MTTEHRKTLEEYLTDEPGCGCATCKAIRAALAELDAQAAELRLLRAICDDHPGWLHASRPEEMNEWKAKYGKGKA